MELIEYCGQPEFIPAINNYQLPDKQAIFSGVPKDAIQSAKSNPDKHPLFLIDKDKLPVFFILHKNQGVEPYSTNEHAILLRSFSTNYAYQGKGYAQASLKLLSPYIREFFPSINEVVLAVNAKNQPAINLYLKCHFQDTNKIVPTDYGQLLIFSKKIK
ncbi:GNAT family N-acetyltransferase [Enterococcus sp. BWR-S5]|uniref:GNAT family N-acetyltransferase n=1 Tax=Enterococcus sp. BWR-S5 TaxID=2787714 RepID=UPI0019222A25|nr:GNAT family N-acetyltransferase [Enterococcus sp. BWR-S5]MBL1224565.1 GNAT family N-acetyltransferase [Enterococcus sp. BWR-S5]